MAFWQDAVHDHKEWERIDLTIHDNIPYIDLGTYECTPYECCHASKIHDLLELSQDGFHNFDDTNNVGRPSRRVHLDGESGLEMSNEDQDDSQHVKKLKKKKKGRAANPTETNGISWRRSPT